MKKLSSSMVVMLVIGTVTPVMAEEGATLYEYHGCINCHGADAKNPISKVIPVIAGKPADELFTQAKKVLSGESDSKESEIMHAAFYSPSQCDAPPTDVELKAITAWVSTR